MKPMVRVFVQAMRLFGRTGFPLLLVLGLSVIPMQAYGAPPVGAPDDVLVDDPNAPPSPPGLNPAQRNAIRTKPPASHNPRLKQALKRLRDRKSEASKPARGSRTRPAAPAKGDRRIKNDRRTKEREPVKKDKPTPHGKHPAKSKTDERSKRDEHPKSDTKNPRDVKDGLTDAVPEEPANSPPVARRIIRRPAPPLPLPVYNETELALQQALKLEVVDLGPFERWQVNVTNQSLQPLRVATDPRLLSFTARVPGRTNTVACEVPKSLQPQGRHTETEVLAPGETYEFGIDPRMYCFESGDQTILVPGTFLVPSYGWEEATRTRWSWGRKYEERLEQHHPFAGQFVGPEAEPPAEVAKRQGLKRVSGEGFALRSEYEGWAKTRLPSHELGDEPQEGMKLSISHGSDAPNARDISVTVRLENLSPETQRVYFRRDLVSFIVEGPDGETECDATAAELRAPDSQAFTTLRPGKAESFTTQLLEFCPAQSFQRPGFYYVRAVLPGTEPDEYGQIDVFTGELAASAPRPIRLHEAELPYVLRRSPAGGAPLRPRGAEASPIIPPPPQPPPPPVPAPPPPPVQ